MNKQLGYTKHVFLVQDAQFIPLFLFLFSFHLQNDQTRHTGAFTTNTNSLICGT
jgi:hypothetical protein